MPKTDFDEFVKRQQAEKKEAATINWDSERDKWLNYLNALYAQIESFLESYLSAGEAQCEYRDWPLNEENIGSYTARQMILKIGRQEVTFTPVGTLLIGMKGRVDVLGPAGNARLALLDKKATSARSLIKVTVNVVGKRKEPSPPMSPPQEPIEWVWKIVSRPP
ncbi:MAG: hypothetical protein WBG11_04975, partial [Methylocella sp.]